MTVGKAKPPAISGPKGGNTKLQLKGRIFMQNVTDVISLARNGTFGVINAEVQELTSCRVLHAADFLEGRSRCREFHDQTH